MVTALLVLGIFCYLDRRKVTNQVFFKQKYEFLIIDHCGSFFLFPYLLDKFGLESLRFRTPTVVSLEQKCCAKRM